LSKRKSEYILDLAAKFKEKQVHPDKWSTMADEDVIAETGRHPWHRPMDARRCS